MRRRTTNRAFSSFAAFSAAYPFDFVWFGNRQDKETGARIRQFPDRILATGQLPAGGRPAFAQPDPTWLKVEGKSLADCRIRRVPGGGGADLPAATRWCGASNKDKRWTEYPKYAFWIFSIAFVGFWQMAQPSITHIMTWFHSILFQWKWELFLSDPFIFLFWWFIIVTVFVWGGAVLRLDVPVRLVVRAAVQGGGKLGLRRFQRKLPQRLHDKLKWLKYVIFAG